MQKGWENIPGCRLFNLSPVFIEDKTVIMKSSTPRGLLSDRYFNGLRLVDYQYGAVEKSEFHTDKYPKISIVLGGQLEEKTMGANVSASPMSVVVKPPDALHANTFGPRGTRIISIIAADENGWPDYLNRAFLGQYAWYHGTPTIGAVSEFLKEFVQLQEASELETAVIQLVAGLSQDPGPPSTSPPRWLRQVAEQLEDCCDETIRIRQLAEESNVHPVYLARVFRQYFHCNPKQYQFHFRLRRALDHLTQEKTLVQVALDNGFADQSHFSRLFKLTTGMSPGHFRKLVGRI